MVCINKHILPSLFKFTRSDLLRYNLKKFQKRHGEIEVKILFDFVGTTGLFLGAFKIHGFVRTDFLFLYKS